MHNTGTSIMDDEGSMVTSHDEKEKMLWEVYKYRLGTSDFTHIYFDLHSLLSQTENLEWLDEPFTKDEIDIVIQNLPSDKSPGSYGFNGDLLKKCWQTISQEFYDLCQGFYEGNICMKSINGSHIVLVPKIDNPTIIGDYRPISLLNSSIKVLTKIM
jgi:hypothetical protein